MLVGDGVLQYGHHVFCGRRCSIVWSPCLFVGDGVLHYGHHVLWASAATELLTLASARRMSGRATLGSTDSMTKLQNLAATKREPQIMHHWTARHTRPHNSSCLLENGHLSWAGAWRHPNWNRTALKCNQSVGPNSENAKSKLLAAAHCIAFLPETGVHCTRFLFLFAGSLSLCKNNETGLKEQTTTACSALIFFDCLLAVKQK